MLAVLVTISMRPRPQTSDFKSFTVANGIGSMISFAGWNDAVQQAIEDTSSVTLFLTENLMGSPSIGASRTESSSDEDEEDEVDLTQIGSAISIITDVLGAITNDATYRGSWGSASEDFEDDLIDSHY